MAALTTMWRQFRNDERGTFAILFALMAIPVLGLSFTAIDYTRALRLEGRLTAAASSAAAAALHKLHLGRTEVEATVRRHLDAELPEHLAGLPFTVVIPDNELSVDVSTEATIPTTLIAMLGVKSFRVTGSSRAAVPKRTVTAKAAQQAIEAALPPGVDKEIVRSLEDLARSGGAGTRAGRTELGSSAGLRQPSEREQEEIRRAAEDAERLLRDAMSRIRF